MTLILLLLRRWATCLARSKSTRFIVPFELFSGIAIDQHNLVLVCQRLLGFLMEIGVG